MSEGKRSGPWANDPAGERRELERRAQRLARPRNEDEHSDKRALAVFERHGTRYAIDPRYVVEVARAPRPTTLPRSERHWLGVTSLHGELMAVAELSALLGNGIAQAPSGQDDEVQLVLVLGEEARELGLAIDSVLEPLALSSALAEPPHMDAASRLIEGVTDEGLRVVRGDLLLSDPRLFVESPSTSS